MSKQIIQFAISVTQIKLKNIPSQQYELYFNLLYNNQIVDHTEKTKIQKGQKTVKLNLKTMHFDTKKQSATKYPIMIQINYGGDKPKKIILRRSEMLKQFQMDSKQKFSINEDFGVFTIFYQVSISKSISQQSNNQIISSKTYKLNISTNKNQTQKTQSKNQVLESPTRNIKRPSMLAVGQAATRIRKSSAQIKQNFKESPMFMIKIQSQLETNRFKKQQDSKKVTPIQVLFEKKISNNQNTQQKLFDNFQQNHSKKGSQLLNNQNIHNSHKSHEGHQTHNDQDHGDHGDHHEDHHGDHQQSSLSLKLKTVILMLIVGFLFLMYDALDDRFARRAPRVVQPIHSQHGDNQHEKVHAHAHVQEKKKKTSKKIKKTRHH